MGEPQSLTAFARPDWFRAVPEAWETRLREVSPVSDTLAHLRFRWRDPSEHWYKPDEPLMQIYSCTPKSMVSAERADQMRLHWSELPVWEQEGRKTYVTSYQHWMWHTHGVDARPFWNCQGEWGGTAAMYTRREVRYLDACNAPSEALPLGFFAACPFDERVVKKIIQRDRLVQASNNLDTLEKMDRPDAVKAEDEAAERVFRTQYLDWWYETIQPQAEFMKSFLRTAEADRDLPRGTPEMADAVSQWKDHWKEFGSMPGVAVAGSRRLQIAVK